MADMSSTRRGLLGAMALAPVAISVPAASLPASSNWDVVMQRYLAAKLKFNEHDRRYIDAIVSPSLPVGPERNAACAKVPQWAWDESTKLCGVMVVFEDQLMEMPAPNAKALLWKLEKVLEVDRDGSTSAWSADYVEPVLKDVRHMAAREAA